MKFNNIEKFNKNTKPYYDRDSILNELYDYMINTRGQDIGNWFDEILGQEEEILMRLNYELDNNIEVLVEILKNDIEEWKNNEEEFKKIYGKNILFPTQMLEELNCYITSKEYKQENIEKVEEKYMNKIYTEVEPNREKYGEGYKSLKELKNTLFFNFQEAYKNNGKDKTMAQFLKDYINVEFHDMDSGTTNCDFVPYIKELDEMIEDNSIYTVNSINEATNIVSKFCEDSIKLNLLKLMDKTARDVNNEDLFVEIWLTDGIPDGATEEDFIECIEYFEEIENVFKALMEEAARDGELYKTTSEELAFARQYEPRISDVIESEEYEESEN